MRNITILSALILLCSAVISYEPKKSTAEAEQIEGICVFTDSKPVLPYEYLGTTKAVTGWDGQYQSVRDKLISKAKKEYPQADGLIFHFTTNGADKCDAIRFK